VNINGSKIQLTPNHALISVARADQKVSQEDIDRIYEEAKVINLQSTNRTILDVFPKEWSLDGEKEIGNPLGLQGVRLELDANLLSVFLSDIDSIVDSLGFADFDIDYENIIPGLIADADAVLTPSQKELGVALLNIGFGTSSIAIFEEGKLLDLAVFPVGSGNITNDIAIGFKTEIETAERIKKEHGTLIPSAAKKTIEFNLSPFAEDDDDIDLDKKKEKKKDKSNILSFSSKDLQKIVEARVMEIFGLVEKELKKVSRQGLLPAGIVITGGGAKLPGIAELAKKEFKLPSRIGVPVLFKGLERDSSLSTVCGLVMGRMDKEEIILGGSGKGIGKKIKGFFENFVP
jgi:cell division protein FtsA